MNKPLSDILILSDFDGTFAGKNGRIVERNIKAIKHFQALGGLFTFSTGRLPSMMKKVFPDFPSIVNAPMIMCNGAIIFDAQNDRIIDERFFDGITAREDIKHIMSKFKISLGCYADDGNLQEVSCPDDIIGNKFRKINLNFDDPETAIACRTYVNDVFNNKYLCFRSFESFAEIVDKNVSKGRRISYMKELYKKDGISDLKVYCIGDYENDIDMLKNADIAFCPSNAVDDVKKHCSYILCNHDEGAIADMIEIIIEKSTNEQNK